MQYSTKNQNNVSFPNYTIEQPAAADTTPVRRQQSVLGFYIIIYLYNIGNIMVNTNHDPPKRTEFNIRRRASSTTASAVTGPLALSFSLSYYVYIPHPRLRYRDGSAHVYHHYRVTGNLRPYIIHTYTFYRTWYARAV